MRKLAVLSLVAMLGVAAVSCAPAAPSPAPTTQLPPTAAPTEVPATAAPATPEPGLADEQVLRVGLSIDDVTSLDPHKGSLVTDHSVVQQIHGALFIYDPSTAELVPELCTDWEVTDDGLVYTFHLQEGVKWHKGYGEFTADDVKFSIERVRDPENKISYAREFDLIEEIEVVDDYTVKMTLEQPYVPFLHKLAGSRQGWIVSRKAVEELGDDIARNPIGTGPFVFDHWTPNTEIVLVANPDYFQGAPVLERLVFVPIPEASVRHMALEAGDIDLIEISDPVVYDMYMEDPDITVKQQASLMYATIGMNNTVEPFDDVRVRRALAYAIDRDLIVEHVLGGLATKADSILPPAFFAYTSDVQTYEYDPDKAVQLLADAGYADGFEITCAYIEMSAYGMFHKAMIAIQEMWADVGVKVNLELIDGATWMEMCRNQTMAMSYAGTARPPDPDINLTAYFHSEGAYPFLVYNHGIDELLDEGRTELDTEARKAIYEEIQHRIAEDAPVIPLFYPDAVIAMRSYVKGMEVNLMRGFWAYETYIEEH